MEEVIGRNADGTGGQKYVRVADADELHAQGTEAYKVGDYEEAQQKWSHALRRRPEDVVLLSNRAAAWLAMGEFQAALDDASRAIELQPKYAKARGRAGAAYAGLGRSAEAVAAYSKALELEPSSAHFQAELARLEAEASVLPPTPGGGHVALSGLALAQECNRLGRPAQAIRELNKLISNKVDDAELYCERSVAYANSNRFALAVEDAGTACYMYGHQHDPELKPWENPKELGIKLMTRQQKNELARKEGRSYLLRGQAEVRLCDYDAAMRTFQLGCKADARLGPEALKDLRQAWIAAKELCRGWRRAGRAPKKRKKAAFLAERRPVIADIEKFAEPADKALALRNLAGIHAKWEMHEEAIELLTLAITHTPADQYLMHQRAKEHKAMGRYDLALPDAQQVVRERPGWIEGIISLGNVEGQLGHWKSAACHWHEALLLQPHNPNLRRDLERASVEMTPSEVEEYEDLIKQRQTGDRYVRSHDEGGVELEVYVEDGREFYRPKGTGERLEKEKLAAYARQAERAAARAVLNRAALPAATSCPAEAGGGGEGECKGGGEDDNDGGGDGGDGGGDGEQPAEVSAAEAQPGFLRDYLAASQAAEAEGGASKGATRFVGEEKALRSAALRRKAAATVSANLPDGTAAAAEQADDSVDAAPKADPAAAPSTAASGASSSLIGRSVVINGLLARPALNGSRGVCTSYNNETGRYNVQLPKGEMIALRPSNLTGATGAASTTTPSPAAGGANGSGSGSAASSGPAGLDADEKERRKRASIGARMAEKRGEKGISWAKKGVNGTAAGIAGSFASEARRQQAADRAAARVSEDFDWEAEAEAERKAKMSAKELELERKALLLKKMATDHMGGMDLGRAIKYLDDAIEMRPMMKELWSNRSYAYEMMHRHEESLSDAEQAIELAPEWPKAYLRAARALMSLDRGSEAVARLRTALEFAPRSETLLAAYKEARALAECTRRTEKAIRASQLPTFNGVGDEDIVGIARGACKVKGCDCNAYIQKHGRTTVLLQGRGHVRQDNDPGFFMCKRCGHDAVSHKDLRDLRMGRSSRPAASGDAGRTPPSRYTNGGGGARGGLNSSYYYAAVGEERRTVPVDEPSRIDASLVGSGLPDVPSSSKLRPGEESSTDFEMRGKGSSGYYYAHGRPTDYQVPSVPKRVEADGSLRPWHSGAPPPPPPGAAGHNSGGYDGYGGARADRDEWQDEADPSALCDSVDPFAVAGDASEARAEPEVDPLAAAFSAK